MPDTARKYELTFRIECRKTDIGWDGLQSLCFSLCRVWVILSQSMEKSWYLLGRSAISIHYLILDPAKTYEIFFLRAYRKGDVSWGSLRFLCISLCRRLLKSMSYPFSEHAESSMLAETVFNFHALAYAADCSKVWVLLRQSMQKGWY